MAASRFAVVLAAGKGTRMRSDRAKVLHTLDGRPMLAHVLHTVAELGCDRTVVVVGYQAEEVAAVCSDHGADTVLQSPQNGTGHAVLQARPLLEGRPGWTLVLCGDVPLLRARTLDHLLAVTREAGAAAGVLTAVVEDAAGYGRILRDGQGRVAAIVEDRDASEEQLQIREYNTGTYCFDNDRLWRALERVGCSNAQGEYYLTDVVALMAQAGLGVEGVVCEDVREVQGINTVSDLERARRDLEAMRRG